MGAIADKFERRNSRYFDATGNDVNPDDSKWIASTTQQTDTLDAIRALEDRIEALEKELAAQKAKNAGGLLCP